MDEIELTWVGRGSTLPEARELSGILIKGIENAVGHVRTTRGEVVAPEDTFALMRSLIRTSEDLGDYSRAFASASKRIRQIAEEELIEAVGANEKHEPRTSMTVPDALGDFRVIRDESTDYEIDQTALIDLVCRRVVIGNKVADDLPGCIVDNPAMTEDLNNILMALTQLAIVTLLGLGNFAPQVTKVKGYAAHLSREGDDRMATAVKQTIRPVRTYKGTKFERKK